MFDWIVGGRVMQRYGETDLVRDWLEGWNSRNIELLMSHYADDAVFHG